MSGSAHGKETSKHARDHSASELPSRIGQELEPSSWLEISQERVDRFAHATDDHRYIHVDPERAARTPFGGTIAHGFLTLSLLDDVHNEPDLTPLMEMLGETTALLAMSLTSGQNPAALVFIQMTGENRFGLNELEIARTITSQATVALENARLFQSSVRTAERFAILNRSVDQFQVNRIPRRVHVIDARMRLARKMLEGNVTAARKQNPIEARIQHIQSIIMNR